MTPDVKVTKKSMKKTKSPEERIITKVATEEQVTKKTNYLPRSAVL